MKKKKEKKVNEKIFMILTNGFDPDVRVYKEAQTLINNGFQVEILCWDRKCQYKDDVVSNISLKRFSFFSKPGTGMRQIIPFIKFGLKVRAYLKDKKYQFLHCHDFDGLVIGMFIKNKKNKNIVFDMHEIYDNYSYAQNKFFKKIFLCLIKKVKTIIYVNYDQLKNISFDLKKVYLPNYPIKKIYLPIKKSESNKIRINYIGSLRDYVALSSLAEITNSKYCIGFYGFGICLDKLRDKYQNKSNVHIYGIYDGIKDSGEIYRNTDILYCSYNPQIKNWKMAYPVKLYEAIATCTPIIVSKDTVVSEFVLKYGIGEAVEYGNSLEIEQAINTIIKNKKIYLNNLKNITNDYSWEMLEKNLLSIYTGE